MIEVVEAALVVMVSQAVAAMEVTPARHTGKAVNSAPEPLGLGLNTAAMAKRRMPRGRAAQAYFINAWGKPQQKRLRANGEGCVAFVSGKA